MWPEFDWLTTRYSNRPCYILNLIRPPAPVGNQTREEKRDQKRTKCDAADARDVKQEPHQKLAQGCWKNKAMGRVFANYGDARLGKPGLEGDCRFILSPLGDVAFIAFAKGLWQRMACYNTQKLSPPVAKTTRKHDPAPTLRYCAQSVYQTDVKLLLTV